MSEHDYSEEAIAERDPAFQLPVVSEEDTTLVSEPAAVVLATVRRMRAKQGD
jgi:hypothetical protein